ncbi:Gp15 family bacteriophage protein [Faecousia sp.]|uniref:Gp15 family bacteriophage protein n=1 Tax=Faecousia sp. TaxID=2952921 RepID=UPI003AB32B29
MWPYIVADFRRDYGIDLAEAVYTLGWRDFNRLLDGLNPWGAVATHYKDVQKRVSERERRKSGEIPAEAKGFWAAMDALKR